MGAPIDSVFQSTHRDEASTIWGPRHRRLVNVGIGAVIRLGQTDGTPPWPDVGPGRMEYIGNIHWLVSPAGAEVFGGASLDIVDLANNSIAIIDSLTVLGGGGVPFERVIQPDIAIMGGEHLIRLQVVFIPGTNAGNRVDFSWSSIVNIRGNASLF